MESEFNPQAQDAPEPEPGGEPAPADKPEPTRVNPGDAEGGGAWAPEHLSQHIDPRPSEGDAAHAPAGAPPSDVEQPAQESPPGE